MIMQEECAQMIADRLSYSYFLYVYVPTYMQIQLYKGLGRKSENNL